MPAKRKPLVIVLIVIAVIILFLVVTPFLINADRFRPEIQQALSEKIGRNVEIGHLSVSLLSGSLEANQISISDDPTFSHEPFITAKSLAIGVEMEPLIFSRELKIHSIELGEPQVQLLRTAKGEWNFATLGATGAAKNDPPGDPPPQAASTSALNSLTIDSMKISNGTISFGRAGQSSRLAYQDVNLDAKNVSQTSAFPMTFSARTPEGGKLSLDAQVGPIGAGDANLMPFQGTMKAEAVPAPDVQNLLAVLGYTLPDGSSLKGGTIKADLTLHGPLEKLVTDGPIEINNVTLAGFSLASKLASALGKAAAGSGNDTVIQLASSKLRYAPAGIDASELNIVIPAIGSVTGSGTIGADNSLNFQLVAKLSGSSPLAALTKLPLFGQSGGLPFQVTGTTAKPEVRPELSGLVKNPLKQLTGSQSGGLGGIVGGLLKKKKPQ